MKKKSSKQDLMEMVDRHISHKEKLRKHNETFRDPLKKKYPDRNNPDAIKDEMNLLSGFL